MISVAHGRYSTYARLGCRCQRCREAQRARVARNRVERLESGRLTHGTRSAYDAGCRCDLCKKSRSEAVQTVDRRSATRREQLAAYLTADRTEVDA